VGDRLFETQTLNHVIDIALHKATLGMLDATKKLGQHANAHLTFDGSSADKPVYCQIDGEVSRISCVFRFFFSRIKVHHTLSYLYICNLTRFALSPLVLSSPKRSPSSTPSKPA
jgi:hypothetical protein